MRYYKFNRDQSSDLLQKYRKSWRKTKYMAARNKSRLLDSLYFENQTWGALHKAWKGYIIGKSKFELDRMEYYASVIRKLQKELGLEISSFPDLNPASLDSFEENPENMPQEISEEEAFELMVKRDQEELEALRQE